MICHDARQLMSSQDTGHIKSTVGANIRAGRDRIGLGQRQLGGLVNGVDGQTVSRWERGLVMPSTENLIALADAFDVPVAWFYVDHGDAAPEPRYTREDDSR